MNLVSVGDATTALFVPGDRPERFEKAVASGADLVIIDLEDAVAPAAKADARAHMTRALGGPDASLSAVVRINALTDGGEVDAKALAAVRDGRLLAVMLPKAEREEDILALGDLLGAEVPIIALIETVAGLRRAAQLARTPGVARLAFGALDFGVDVDATDPTLLDHARCELVLASRESGVAAPLESPNPDFRDLESVGRQARRSRALGFGGQLCIHPAQLPVVAEAFRPTAEEVAWAARVLASTTDGVAQVDGAMVDRPVLERARRIQTRARAGGA